jgi:hypothetical protein
MTTELKRDYQRQIEGMYRTIARQNYEIDELKYENSNLKRWLESADKRLHEIETTKGGGK